MPSKLAMSTMGSTKQIATLKASAISVSQQASQSTVKLVAQTASTSASTSTVTKTSASKSAKAADLADKQPAQVLREQAHARVQAQLRAQDVEEGGIDENADLPDIRSE